MKSQPFIEIVVGLFVTLAVVGLIVGIVWGKNLHLFADSREVRFSFNHVDGLEKGAPVVILGIPFGEVKSIALHNSRVETVIWVQKEIPVYNDLQACIRMKDLMGGKQIDLDPGKSGIPYDPNVCYQGNVEPDIVSVIQKAQHTLVRLDALILKSHSVMDSVDVSSIAAQTRILSREASELIKETRVPLNSSLVLLENILNQLKTDSTAARFGKSVQQMDSTFQSLNRVILSIHQQQGTMGQLVYDKALYTDLVQTTNRLDSLIRDFKEHPKKYIHVSVF